MGRVASKSTPADDQENPAVERIDLVAAKETGLALNHLNREADPLSVGLFFLTTKAVPPSTVASESVKHW